MGRRVTCLLRHIGTADPSSRAAALRFSRPPPLNFVAPLISLALGYFRLPDRIGLAQRPGNTSNCGGQYDAYAISQGQTLAGRNSVPVVGLDTADDVCAGAHSGSDVIMSPHVKETRRPASALAPNRWID